MTFLRPLASAVLVTILALLAGCAEPGDVLDLGREDVPRGRLLLWHTWTGAEAQVLDEMLARYMELHPQVKIVTAAFQEDEIVEAFADSSASGLGPDFLLVDAGTLYDLAQAGLVRELSTSGLDFSQILSSPLRMVSSDDAIYGLPFAAHTQVLFYNRDKVEDAPQDFWDWLARAQGGEVYALNPGFAEAFWGIGAYGGGALDPETGEILMRLGGYKNWLDALRLLRNMPSFLLDDDSAALRQAFIDGEADFYLGSSSDLPDLRAALGEDAVGVAALPYGPNGSSARPLLNLATFAFSSVSNPDEFVLAQGVAAFLGGPEVQLSLGSADVGRVPVSNQVRLSSGMPASTVTIASQMNSAQSIKFATQRLWRELEAGALGFLDDQQAVVAGIVTPDEMIDRTIRNLKETYGLEERVIDPADLCPEQPVAIEAWHSLPAAEAEALAAIADDFAEVCTGSQVTMTYVPNDEIYDRYTQALDDGSGPDLLLGLSSWLPELAEQELILDISELIEPESLQRYQPRAPRMMRYQDRLYAIPESVLTPALYYNTELVADPPLDLDAMLQSIDIHRRWALPVGFFWGYWGIAPFGGLSWDGESGEILDASGLVEWLRWLQKADKRPGVDLYFDWRAAEDAFVNGEAAYLVSGPWSLSRIRQELGDDGFRVVTLPGRSLGPGSPLLQVNGAMVSSRAGEAEAQTALAFARFANLNANQERLVETGQHVSASVTVDLADDPSLASFRSQGALSAMVEENSVFDRMQMLGDELYRAVLIEGQDPAVAVERFIEAVRAANRAADAAGDSNPGRSR